MKLTLEDVNDRAREGVGVRLENRTGVNTGEVVAGDVSTGQRLVTGDTVNTAARLEQSAPTSRDLDRRATYRLVRDAVEVEQVEPSSSRAKRSGFRPTAWSPSRARRGRGPTARFADGGPSRGAGGPHGALEAAEREVAPQMVTVFGPAGVGNPGSCRSS